MPLSTLSYLVCGMVEYFMEQGGDVESGLRTVGYEVGIKLLEVYGFERELHIPTLLYRLTFNLLPGISDNNRKVERAEGRDDMYLVTDYDGVFSRFISVPPEWEGFSADSLTCGIIQAVLMASGYESEVTAFPKPVDGFPNRVVFQVKVLRQDTPHCGH